MHVPTPNDMPKRNPSFKEKVEAPALITAGEIDLNEHAVLCELLPGEETKPVAVVKRPFIRKPHLTARPFMNHPGLLELKNQQHDFPSNRNK